VAVDGVEFELERGKRVALVGESGSGKSVTSLSILGLLPPPGRVVSGRVSFDGVDLLALSEKDWPRVRGGRIAWIPQDPSLSLHPMYRVGDQLSEVLSLHSDLDDAAVLERAEELLSEVGLPDPKQALSAWPHQLSGGMRQRVVIAMALAGGPELIIADEAMTALDVTTQAQVLERLTTLCDTKGVAVLFISHDLSVVSELCERVLVMHSGKIVEDRPTSELISKPQAAYTRRLIASIPRLGQRERLFSPPRVGSRAEGGA
jgi:ABC-type dipeptide/oligopeptide/nickel transport system ATPase component